MAGFQLQEAPARPSDSAAGPIPPDESWSQLESWIWEKLQAGAIANIDEYGDGQGRLPLADPRKPEDWQDGRRRLAPRFLEDLLLREPYRSGLHRKGVRIRGAWFDREVDLEWASIARRISLDRCRCEQALPLTGLNTPYSVSFEGSACAADLQLALAQIGAPVGLVGAQILGTLMMDSVDVSQSLLMRSDRRVAEHQAEFNNVILTGAKIGGQISLIGARVGGTLDVDSADIGSLLLMRSDHLVAEHQAEFNNVVLRGAKVGGNVDLIGAKVAGTLDMDSVEIGQNLFMRSDGRVSEHRAEFKRDVILRGAKIAGQISLIGAKVAGKMNMGSANVGGSLFMHSSPGMPEQRAEFDSRISLVFAEFGRNLDVRGAVLSSLDLTGATIRGELRLASPSWSPRWRGNGRLMLRNASADAIADTEHKSVWPRVLELDGFTYQRLGGLGADAEASVAKRGSRWFIDWLARDEPYTPQPYQQCAQVLREMGHPEMANAVLYAGRERERKEAWRTGNNPRGTGLTLLRWFVGYGYGQRLLWHPLAWVVALVAAGTAVLHLTGVPKELAGSEAAVVAYSFDTLLPIVELEKSFADIVLRGFAKYYFYFQKLMGWVLASFLIAGLSGLTK